MKPSRLLALPEDQATEFDRACEAAAAEPGMVASGISADDIALGHILSQSMQAVAATLPERVPAAALAFAGNVGACASIARGLRELPPLEQASAEDLGRFSVRLMAAIAGAIAGEKKRKLRHPKG